MNNENKILSDITVHMKYADARRRKEKLERIMRKKYGMHIQKFPELGRDKERISICWTKVLPSMRSIQFAGKPIEVSPNRVTSCAYCPVDNQSLVKSCLLLGGAGVGFSVQTHHVEKLPEIKRPNQKRTKDF